MLRVACALSAVDSAETRNLALPTLSELARANFHTASAYGSGALLLAFSIRAVEFLADAHFTFYITHRLLLPHPTRPTAALAVCSRLTADAAKPSNTQLP